MEENELKSVVFLEWRIEEKIVRRDSTVARVVVSNLAVYLRAV